MKTILHEFKEYSKTISKHLKAMSLFIFITVFFAYSGFAQTTYNGNGNTGFGDPVGSSSLVFDDDGTTITGTFTKGSSSFNNEMVIYIDSDTGGFNSTANFDDPNSGDKLRRAIAGYGGFAGSTRSIVNFPSGFEPDYAIAINTGFGGLWELINNAAFTFITGVGQPSSATDPSFSFSFNWSDISGSPSNGFRFVITYLDGFGGGGVFRSDEGYGDGLPNGNPGTSDVTFTSFRNYPNYYVFDGTSWSPSNPDGVTQISRDASVKSGNTSFTSDTSLRDLSIESGAELSISPSTVLSLDGDLENNGSVVFESDASGSSQLDEFSGTLSGTGSFTSQRFIPAGDNNKRVFRFLSSSVSTSTSIRDNWQEGASSNTDDPSPGFGTHITGSTTDGMNGFDGTTSGTPSLLVFDNASQTWGPISNTDVNTLQTGSAYNLFVRGDRSIVLTNASQTPTNTTLRATGSLDTGNVDLSADLASGNDEWSLVGNPYQATVDFNALTFTGDIKTTFYYEWNSNSATAGAYEIRDNTAAAQQMIRPGQSFFVQNSASVTTAPGLEFTESAKNPTGMVNNVFDDSPVAIADLELYNTNNIRLDVMKFRFEAGADNGLDNFDGGKLNNTTENIASVNSNTLLALERRDIPQQDEIVDLFIEQYQFTQYEFRLNTANWDDDIEVFLVDNYLNTSTLINENQSYSFNIDSSIPESIATDRFDLVFDNTTLGVNDNAFGKDFSLYPNPTKDGLFSIKTQNLNADDVNIRIHNLMGQQVMNQNYDVQSNGEININASDLSSGVYMVEINQNGQSITTKLIIQ